MEFENVVREKLDRNKPVYGVRIRSFSTTLLQVLGTAGVDYGYLDLEHAGYSPYDSVNLERMQIATESTGVGLVVRLPDSEPAMVRTALDAGVRTVIVPRVETAEEVERVVRASRYQYDEGPGERGFGTAPSNNWGIRPDGYTQREDESVLIGIMLETEDALENVREIVSVPELGFVKIGVGDLSVSLGHPQKNTHREVQDGIEKVEQVCRDNNMPLGRGVSGVEEAHEAVTDGYTLIDIGGDVEILRSTLKERVDKLNDNLDADLW